MTYFMFHRLSPNLPCSRKDISSGINIAVKRTAARAGMPTNRQVFWHLFAALAALLACTAWIDFHNLNTGAFSLVFQDTDEASPASISDRFGQPMVLEHISYVQAFHRDQAVSKDQTNRDLIMMLATDIAYAGVDLLKFDAGLAAVLGANSFSGNGPLRYAQARKFGFEMPWVLFSASVTGCQEVYQPNVDSCRWFISSNNRDVRQFTQRDYVPFSQFSLQCDIPNGSHNRSVQVNTDCSHKLNPEPVTSQANTVAVRCEPNAVELISSLIPWKPWFLSMGYAAEEVSEAFIQSPHCDLCGREIEPLEILIREALLFEPPRTIDRCYRGPQCIPGELPHAEAFIVQSPMRFKHDAQFAILVGVSPESVFEGAEHLFTFRQISVYRPANQFCYSNAASFGYPFKCGNLSVGKMVIDSPHSAYSIHTSRLDQATNGHQRKRYRRANGFWWFWTGCHWLWWNADHWE